MTFDLILVCDGTVLATATSPEELDFERVYPYERWGVVVRYSSGDGLSTFTRALARVDLSGSEDYRSNADNAVAEVRRELVGRYKAGEFDRPEYLTGDLAIDVSFVENDNEH